MKLTLNEEIIKDYTGMFRCKPDLLITKYLHKFSDFVFADNIKDLDQFQFPADIGYNYFYDETYGGYFYTCHDRKQGIWPSFKINNSSDFQFNDGQVINYCGFRWVIIIGKGKSPKYYAFKSEPIMEGGKIKDFSQEPALGTALQLWASKNGIGKFDKNKIQNIPQATDGEKIISLLATALNDKDRLYYPTSYFKPFSVTRLPVKNLRPYIESNDFQALFEAASSILGSFFTRDDIENAFADVLGVYVESPKVLNKNKNILTLSQYLSFSDSQKKTLLDAAKGYYSKIVFDSFTPDRKYFYYVEIDQPDVIIKSTNYYSGVAFNIEVLDYNSIRYLNITDGEQCRISTSIECKRAIGKIGSEYFLVKADKSNWTFSYHNSMCICVSSGTDELIDYPNAVVGP